MTKREFFEYVAETMADNAEIVEFCTKEIASIDRKNEYARTHRKSGKVSKADAEKRASVDATLTAIINEIEGEFTVADLSEQVEISKPAISASLKRMVAEGVLTAFKPKASKPYVYTRV